MIEKIMRAVKSNNKKRGRNITIGAVVGMLLSCSTVMGADVVVLEITKGENGIEFSKDGNPFEPGIEGDPYPENTWEDNTYTNNMTISGEATTSVDIGIGIQLSGELKVNLTNNGAIIGSSSGSGYEIVIYSLTGNLTNNGIITGSGPGFGIRIASSLTGNLTNNGIITGSNSSYGYGIVINSLTGNLTNNGTITGSSSDYGYGIRIASSLTGNLTNNGIITGSNSSYGYGIYMSTLTENLTNTGVVYGKTSAISIANTGATKSAYNCGLLVTEGSKAVEGKVNFAHNYGLAFKVGSYGSYTLDDYSGEFGKIYNDKEIVIGYEKDAKGKLDFEKPIIDKYTIINAKEDKSDSDIKGTVSLTLENGKLKYYDSGSLQTKAIDTDKKYILNGITNTLEVKGTGNKLNNSVINAYKTAVNMSTGSNLTLGNTVINGGMKADTPSPDDKIISTVNIECDGSALTLKGDSVINVKDGGVAITVDGSDNAVVLKGNAIVNGKMEASGDRNILDLDGTGKDGMNMHHDISGFEKMAIDNNVTFFEDMKVTGTTEVTVEGTGVLNLRLKKKEEITYSDSSSSIPTAIHAFSGTSGTTIIGNSPEEAGTLNFITNGIGRVIDVDMKDITLKNMKIKASSIIDKAEIHEDFIRLGAGSDLGGIVNPKVNKYNSLNKIYKSIYNSTDEKTLDELRDILNITYIGKNYDYNNITDEEQLANLLSYLNDIYTGTPYSYSSELSRKSTGMFRDIVTENEFRPNLNNWLIMGGFTHTDGGTKDTYYGKNYYKIDSGSSTTNADMKLTGAYMLAKYGYSEDTSLGLTFGGNKSEAKMDISKVKGNSGYIGAFAENYKGNLILKAGAGIQYSEYDADRRTIGGHSYSDKYSDMAYDIYLNGRYSHQVGDNLYLEPYATLSYTYVDQDGANEGSKALAIKTDSKSFDYTVGKVGVDLKKVIPHEKGKSTLSAGVSYTKIFDGADEEYITGRFKGGSDFDILVAHKNEHSIGLNAKYALELESGVIFDVKGTYSVERDSHNGSAKNKTKGEWIVGAGVGYKF